MNAYPRVELPRLINRTTLPGVDDREVRVLREWIRRFGEQYDELRFNVRVGAGVQLAGDYPQQFKIDWMNRTKMRLDCVAWNAGDAVTLIEAKVEWTNDAVWQLLSYRDAYRDEFPDASIALAGVCEAYTPQARQLAADQGITLHVFTFAAPPPIAGAAPASE